jgi:hypothetical protein
MEFKINTRQKHILDLSLTKIFKEKYIVLKIDNNSNVGTDDFDAEACITTNEALELIEKLQILINTNL